MSRDLSAPATSPHRLRESNRLVLLQHALYHPVFSASDAMAATGLTRATVLRVADDLVAAGWLREGGPDGDPSSPSADGAGRRGRPARRFRLRDDALYIAGVDAGAHTVRAHLHDLRGRQRSQVEVDIVAGEEAPTRLRLRAVADALRATADEAGVGLENILACAVGVPAPVDSDGRSPVGANPFWDRMNPGPEAIASALPTGMRLLIDNDANLAALAESSRRGGGDVIALLSGERLGAGLVVDGRLIRGAHGGAGEMRFLDALMEPGHGTDGVGPLLRRAAADALAHNGGAPTLLRDENDGAGAPSAAQVLRAAEASDAIATAVLENIAQRLARIVLGIATLTGVEQVILAGAFAEEAAVLRDRTQQIMEVLLVPPVPTLMLSELGPDAVATGAVQAARSAVLSDPLSLQLPQ